MLAETSSSYSMPDQILCTAGNLHPTVTTCLLILCCNTCWNPIILGIQIENSTEKCLWWCGCVVSGTSQTLSAGLGPVGLKVYQMPKHCAAVYNTINQDFTTREMFCQFFAQALCIGTPMHQWGCVTQTNEGTLGFFTPCCCLSECGLTGHLKNKGCVLMHFGGCVFTGTSEKMKYDQQRLVWLMLDSDYTVFLSVKTVTMSD